MISLWENLNRCGFETNRVSCFATNFGSYPLLDGQRSFWSRKEIVYGKSKEGVLTRSSLVHNRGPLDSKAGILLCKIDWSDEAMKPRNHATWRLLNVPEMDWMKPWNHETTKPWNLTSSQCPRDGLDETTKPWNHVSWFHGVHGEISHETRNHETSGFVFKKGPWSSLPRDTTYQF